ncbi:hypothetical protein HMN09_00414100 [Mycena chlorophos]|uniref:Uncharacterized protein n=1 Tax=Mycena chlorophos TaxID=658473 RepID=A0A8H6TJE2_MYCCL|nr:hypothetical protein HMN09_00414100 [Mycena chlorophos]
MLSRVRRVPSLLRCLSTVPISIKHPPPPVIIAKGLRKLLGPKTSETVIAYNHQPVLNMLVVYHDANNPQSVAALDLLYAAQERKTYTRLPHAPLRFNLAVQTQPISAPALAALLRVTKEPWLEFVKPLARGLPEVRELASQGFRGGVSQAPEKADDADALAAKLTEDDCALLDMPIVVILPRADSLPGFNLESSHIAGKPPRGKAHRQSKFIPSSPPCYVGKTAGLNAVNWLQYERRKKLGRGQLAQLKGMSRIHNRELGIDVSPPEHLVKKKKKKKKTAVIQEDS